MGEVITLSIADATALAMRAFRATGVTTASAEATAKALVATERDGQKGHGLSRVSSYCEQVRAGKIDPDAAPTARRLSDGATLIDAAHGFAYPAIDLAIEELRDLAQRSIIAAAAIRRSHHFGQAGAHVERLAEAGLVAFLFGNTPKGIAFWGGARPMMGTNPIAFAAPLPDGPPLVIDLALSVAARGKIMATAKTGEDIPEGWAFDAEGNPTTNAEAALAGSMAPLGGAKGAALALMVEVIAAALTGSNFGFEASSFLNAEGPAPDVGCLFVAIDPKALAGDGYFERIGTLAAAIEAEPGARLPGQRRLENRQRAGQTGLHLARALFEEIKDLAEG